MRKIIAVLGIAMLGTLGCRHVGGKCDCGTVPGEASLYAPLHGYPPSVAVKDSLPNPKETKK
jgi:hypothetical protein